MTSIYLYKRDGGNYTSYRYEISNIERVDIQLNTPVAAMPLPMETREENILVKMEGNSEVVQMTWRIPEEAVVRVKTKTSSTLGDAINQKKADDDAKYEWAGSGSGAYAWESGNPVDTTTGTATRGRNDVVNYLLSAFEGRDIEDEYYLSIPEMDAREGWLSQLNATISGDSPVVWTVSATFQTGRVISMYDMDAPSEPRDVTLVPCDTNGKIEGEGGWTGTNNKLRLKWVIPVESGGSGIAKYNLYTRTDNSQWMEFTETAANVFEYVLAVGGSGVRWHFRVSASNTYSEGMKSGDVSAVFP